MVKRKDILVEVTDTERRYVLQLNILVTVRMMFPISQLTVP